MRSGHHPARVRQQAQQIHKTVTMLHARASNLQIMIPTCWPIVVELWFVAIDISRAAYDLMTAAMNMKAPPCKTFVISPGFAGGQYLE